VLTRSFSFIWGEKKASSSRTKRRREKWTVHRFSLPGRKRRGEGRDADEEHRIGGERRQDDHVFVWREGGEKAWFFGDTGGSTFSGRLPAWAWGSDWKDLRKREEEHLSCDRENLGKLVFPDEDPFSHRH